MFWPDPPRVLRQVLLVSAQEALLSRLVLRRQPVAASEVVRRFKERAFGSSRAVQRRVYTQADLEQAARDMCEDSGESVFAFSVQPMPLSCSASSVFALSFVFPRLASPMHGCGARSSCKACDTGAPVMLGER